MTNSFKNISHSEPEGGASTEGLMVDLVSAVRALSFHVNVPPVGLPDVVVQPPVNNVHIDVPVPSVNVVVDAKPDSKLLIFGFISTTTLLAADILVRVLLR